MKARQNPALSFRFLVEIDGDDKAAFTECTGLTVERDVEPVREGGLNEYVHQLPGRVHYPNIVLKRGITDSKDLFRWFKGDGGVVEPKNITITLYLDDTNIRSWNVERAYPIKWVGPDFDSSRSAVAIESVELVHCGFSAV